MANNTSLKSRALLVAAVAACTVMVFPDLAFSRGGGGGGRGGGGGGRSSARSTSRRGPASSGSVKRSRARASGRGHRASGRADRPSTGHRPGTKPETKPGTKPGRHPNTRRYHRWLRRRGGRRIAVADWGDLDCTRSERVDGVSYFYCDGTWWEKVMDGGEVYWVEVEKPD